MSDPVTPPVMGDVPPADAPVMDAPAPAVDMAEFERTKAALKLANKEAADRRKRLEELEKAENERKTAELSDIDRLKAEAADWRRQAEEATTQRQTLARERAIDREARQMAIFADDAIGDLVGFLPADLDADDASAVQTALKKLASSKKYLLKQAPQPGDGNGASNGKNTDLYTDQELADIKQKYRIR